MDLSRAEPAVTPLCLSFFSSFWSEIKRRLNSSSAFDHYWDTDFNDCMNEGTEHVRVLHELMTHSDNLAGNVSVVTWQPETNGTVSVYLCVAFGPWWPELMWGCRGGEIRQAATCKDTREDTHPPYYKSNTRIQTVDWLVECSE